MRLPQSCFRLHPRRRRQASIWFAAALLLGTLAGCSQRIGGGAPPVPQTAFVIVGEQTAASTGLHRVAVSVPPATPRDRLCEIRDYLDHQYRARQILQVTFYDDSAAAGAYLVGRSRRGDDSHLLAQYLHNRPLATRWWGRPGSDARDKETWE